MLRVTDVHVRFMGVEAVSGVDLEVDAGEVVALMGPSGCGESTLLRVIAGLQTPDAGRVEWNGRDITNMPPHRRGIGLMFQDYALFPHLDVAGNVAFGLRMAGMDRVAISSRVGEVLSLVGLPGYQAREVAELSGGEQQRVALARTIATEPDVIMLDEPIGALDRTLRERLIIELRDLFTSLGIGVLYVTHDQEEAFAVADRVGVMRAGRLEQVATPELLWKAPATAFVARFIGLRNVFKGMVAAGTLDLGFTRLASDAAPGPLSVVVPRQAVKVDPSGPIDAAVRSATYRGGSYRVEALCRDVLIEFDAPSRLSAGESVRLTFDADQVISLAD